MNIVFDYIAPKDGVTRHMWTAKGENGAVHVWAEPHTADLGWGEKFYGGIEIHSPKRLYESDWAAEPSHVDCWLLNGPCWHDGSSLYFSEKIEPLLRHANDPFDAPVHAFINAVMADWYQSRFAVEDAA